MKSGKMRGVLSKSKIVVPARWQFILRALLLLVALHPARWRGLHMSEGRLVGERKSQGLSATLAVALLQAAK